MLLCWERKRVFLSGACMCICVWDWGYSSVVCVCMRSRKSWVVLGCLERIFCNGLTFFLSKWSLFLKHNTTMHAGWKSTANKKCYSTVNGKYYQIPPPISLSLSLSLPPPPVSGGGGVFFGQCLLNKDICHVCTLCGKGLISVHCGIDTLQSVL